MSKRYKRPLGTRITSVLEDGYGDEGPLATGLAYALVGGCMFSAIVIFLGVLAVAFTLVVNLIKWLT